jgi:hypothetical protein
MKRRKVNSFNLLTPEDKQYLRRVSRYLGSLGMRDGTIELELDNSYVYDFSDINWENEASHFSNNYSAEVPDGLLPIFKKIGDYIEENDLLQGPEEDDINYERIDIDIDTEKQEISMTHWWSFYGRGDSNSVSWDGEEGKQMLEEWEKEGVLEDLEIPNNGILTLKYNGSGDSGYIESSFEETGDHAPTTIEDWCYRELERNFGGWEINEGSDGEFVFNFHDMTVELNHTYNTEETEVDTIYEESFTE